MIGSRIGNIRIERLIGQGGMGRVYLGFDEKLERRVAVKTIRSERRLGEEIKARFLREARLLSKLEHPNICRVYDLLEGEDTDYLVLEYIEGTSLRQLAEGGLEVAQSLRVVEQVAAALAAAHGEKIVHRDLKPDNVIVTPDDQVKVLDFGIARSMEPTTAAADRGAGRELTTVAPTPSPDPRAIDDTDSSVLAGVGNLSQDGDSGRATTTWEGDRPRSSDEAYHSVQGAIVGTPRYMSPEQASGEELTAASDIYSLGVLLQELLTGRPAYEQTTDIELLLKVSQGDTVPVSDIDPDLAALIEQLTAVDPGDRPTAAEAIDRLRWVAAKPARRRRRRWLATAAAAVVLLLSVTAVLTYRVARPRPLLAPGEGGRVTLLPFANATGDPGSQWVELGLMEMAAETLDAVPGIDLVPVHEVLSATRELSIDPRRPLDQRALDRLRRALGSRLIVRTEASRGEHGWTLGYEVYRPGARTFSRSVRAAEPTEAANLFASRLALRLDPESSIVELADRFSDDPHANRTYAMGVQARWSAGPKVARHYFEVCLDRDPEMLWARLQLALVLHQLGHGDDSGRLLEQVLAESRRRQDPTLLAAAARGLAQAAHDRGDFAGASEILAEALAVSRQAGDREGIVSALNELAINAHRRNQLEEARQLWGEAITEARQLRSRRWQAGLLNNLALLAFDDDDLARAEEMWTESAAAFHDLGDRRAEAVILGNLGLVEDRRGEFDAAAASHRAELELHRDLGDRQAELIALVNLAGVLLRALELQEAEQTVLEGAALAQALDNRMAEVYMLAYLGFLRARRGATDEAWAHAQGALTLSGATDSPASAQIAHLSAAYCALRVGDLNLATHHLEQAEAVEVDANTRALRARCRHARGDFQGALSIAEEAREQAGPGWPPLWEADRKVYEEAARLGRRVPLPEERPAASPS